jgi:hypothetical protein
MTDNIISISDVMASKPDALFLGCAACQCSEFLVVTLPGKDGRFIASLVCVSEQCNGQTEIPIANGFLA